MQEKTAAAPDFDFVFREVLRQLLATGVPESSARSFLGAQLGLYGASRVALVGRRMIALQPIDPRSWLRAALRKADVLEEPGRDGDNTPTPKRNSKRPAAALDWRSFGRRMT